MRISHLLAHLTPANGFFAAQPACIPDRGYCVYVYDHTTRQMAIAAILTTDTWAGMRRIINGWLRFAERQPQACYRVIFFVSEHTPPHLVDQLRAAPAADRYQFVFAEELAGVA